MAMASNFYVHVRYINAIIPYHNIQKAVIGLPWPTYNVMLGLERSTSFFGQICQMAAHGLNRYSLVFQLTILLTALPPSNSHLYVLYVRSNIFRLDN